MLTLFLFVVLSQTNPSTPTPPPATAQAAAQPIPTEVQRELDLQRRALELQIREGDRKLEEEISPWGNYLKFASGMGGLSLFIALGLIFKASSFVDSHIRRVLEERADEVFAVAEAHLRDRGVLERRRILIVNTDGGSALKARLLGLGFKHLQVKDIATLHQSVVEGDTLRGHDLLLFDHLPESDINRIMEQLPDQVCLGYTPERLSLTYTDRINMANNPMTLFTRILETARYQDALSARAA